MTLDEKLAVIAGNLREAAAGGDRIDGFLEGNLYELALLAGESDGLDTARLILPENDPRILALFCRIYHKYYGDQGRVFPQPESAERLHAVAIPEIARLDESLSLLRLSGIQLEREYGDSFASCAEDVEYGNSKYVLMPYEDPEEGRLRSFEKLRDRYGLKIHCVLYVTDGSGKEYAYQLCGLGFPDEGIFPLSRISFTAETKHEPIQFLAGTESFGAKVLSAEFQRKDGGTVIKAALDTELTDRVLIGGLLMYLNAASDLIINGAYAEIHHKSKGQ